MNLVNMAYLMRKLPQYPWVVSVEFNSTHDTKPETFKASVGTFFRVPFADLKISIWGFTHKEALENFILHRY